MAKGKYLFTAKRSAWGILTSWRTRYPMGCRRLYEQDRTAAWPETMVTTGIAIVAGDHRKGDDQLHRRSSQCDPPGGLHRRGMGINAIRAA